MIAGSRGSCVGLLAVLGAVVGAADLFAQSTPSAEATGIPVTSPVVQRACGACHPPDDGGRMSRISFQRTTPEGWQQTIRRMVLLNGLQIEAAEAREAVRYLATAHGLAPEEARPAAFEVERRMIDHVYDADPETQETCTKCHSMGRVISQRRTREEWQLLTTMHLGLYPLTDFQSFYGRGPAPSSEAGGDSRYPVEKAVGHLSEAFPLETPEWAAWRANMRPPQLAGTWVLVGAERGKGPVYGSVTITASTEAEDQFETESTYVYARTGETVTRRGQATVYTGFQWRGRSTTSDGGTLREVMFVERDWQEVSGRWFTGDHDELGLDITLRRVASRPMVSGVEPPSVRTAAADVALTIYGANLPPDIATGEVDLGPGLTVTQVVEASPSHVTIRASVEDGAAVGTRDMFLAGGFLRDALSVYDQIDRIAVSPRTGMARIGGIVFPKQYERFEARAYHDGPDGRPRTADDLDLGLFDVDWSLEEYAVTYADDDVQFVGAIDANGFFTPAPDGPNPERLNSTNNIGDVWVVATLGEDAEGRALPRVLRARAHLLVTVPIYIRREQSVEVQ